ncbi:xanthine dehydrogenase family protein subunit M [Streptomyces sp. NL15-2K]|uniref:FAD binding domain-containing protein n=1 Tax=Streptomyces sp. NL15-2K TaxID=376149 RepID=UPI000F589829|nr:MULTISPECIES: xanthine dehydrogenase family protein subunit M [Actinomycetes]WKX15468.1 xanthine dehydrogenase family protein subunit M [Kutzneria buriramensis]GCB52653.1 carbon monoxide dehydrogenase medium chain [Streptomyces sp. NL15-2K]
MKPAPFTYHAPADADEAVGLLAELGDEAKAIAGGQSLVPMLALRLASFGHLVDLRRLDELRGIERRGDDTVWIGAATTQATVQRSDEARTAVPLLARATPFIGHFQIRSRGTVGGSLAHADSAAEYPAVALTLDAELEALSPRGRRTIPAARFLTGMWSTALADDELLTGVNFPIWKGRCGFAIEEFARRSGDFAIAGATVALRTDDDGRLDRCAIGLFGLGPTAVRARDTEAALIGSAPLEADAEEIGRTATEGLGSVPSDLHGSAPYRTRVGAAMVARAWRRAVQEALHG